MHKIVRATIHMTNYSAVTFLFVRAMTPSGLLRTPARAVCCTVVTVACVRHASTSRGENTVGRRQCGALQNEQLLEQAKHTNETVSWNEFIWFPEKRASRALPVDRQQQTRGYKPGFKHATHMSGKQRTQQHTLTRFFDNGSWDARGTNLPITR